jgi:hypothetical protein
VRGFPTEEVVIVRNGQEFPATVSMQGSRVHAEEDVIAREGDTLRWSRMGEEYIVSKVERYPGGELGHAVLHIVSPSAWRRMHPDPQPSVTQNFGTAGVVAGRDIHGGVTFNMTATDLLDVVRKAIEADANVPEPEKKTLLEKLKEIATNPSVIGLGAAAIAAAMKAMGYSPK